MNFRPKLRCAAIAVLCVAAAGCAGIRYPVLNTAQSGAPVLAKGQPELALLDYVINHRFADRFAPFDTICVGRKINSGQHAPYEELEPAELSILRARNPRLANADRCDWTSDGAFSGGEPAVMADVHSFECSTSVRCEAWAGFRIDGQQNGWSFYDLRYKGRWIIRRKDLGIVLTGGRTP